MVKCWASTIGGCSNKLSGEHYISKGLWLGRTLITISGFEWLKGEEKILPVQKLTGKILCTSHNNQLSPLDSEAVEFIKKLTEVERVLHLRLKSRKRIFDIRRCAVDGEAFQRWAVKTVIGCSYIDHKDRFWHLTRRRIGEPPPEVVKAVYGLSPLIEPMGLYFGHDLNDKNHRDFFQDGISIETLFHPDGGLVGALLRFRGFRFLVWLTTESYDSLDVRDSAGASLESLPKGPYRPGDYKFCIGKALSHILKFKW
jgi:hypothetical protein